MQTSAQSALLYTTCLLLCSLPNISSERRQNSQLKIIDTASIRSRTTKVPDHTETSEAPDEIRNHSFEQANFHKSGIPTNSHGLQYYHTSDQSNKEIKVSPNLNRKTAHKINVDYQSNLKHHRAPPKTEPVKEKFTANISVNEDEDEYKPSKHMENKQNHIKSVLLKLLNKSENNQKFAEILPILKVMSPPQRLAMASLVTKQISADGKNPGMNLAQVKSMFGNNSNITADLMLPIMLDIANLFRAIKDFQRKQERGPEAQFLRSFSGSGGAQTGRAGITDIISDSIINLAHLTQMRKKNTTMESRKFDKSDTLNLTNLAKNSTNKDMEDKKLNISTTKNDKIEEPSGKNSTIVASNSTAEDLPVAEKLRRNGPPPWARYGPASAQRRRPIAGAHRRHEEQPRPALNPVSCNFFTETLCLDTSDYPIHAIMTSIRKNPNAMGALHSDFPSISADSAIDGVSTFQENKYTPEHYLNNINRREDGLIRPAEASGFMCPSLVKYARPQKARATSGQWKYIVNTEEHTQTLRLEKCLKSKESCTYLTDNFRSKCVQIYNYHRLLTWDNQNGLHMDIFKVPTCCSCHIDGYTVAFPPNVNKPAEITSERFPGEDLSDSDRNPFESIQHAVRRPPNKDILSALRNQEYQNPEQPLLRQTNGQKNKQFIRDPQFPINKHFPIINDNFNQDVFQQEESNNIRNIKKPLRETNAIVLPTFLEPPIKTLNNGIIVKSPDINTKYKTFGNSHNKRGTAGTQSNILKRPIRKPIRKKNPELDDQLVGASNIQEHPTIINAETFDDINEALNDYESSSETTIPSKPRTTPSTTTSAKQNTSKAPNIPERPISAKPERGTAILKDISLNRRVNYNYHPIIDFFEEGQKESNQAEDRSDSEPFGYVDSEESDWKPMAGPMGIPLKPRFN